MASSISKITKKIKQDLKEAKLSSLETILEADKIKQILKNIDLTLENQITAEEVFAICEQYLEHTLDEEFNTARNVYIKCMNIHYATLDKQKERTLFYDQLKKELSGKELDDETIKKLYDVMHELHELFGQEIAHLNYRASAGVVFLDKIKARLLPDPKTLN